MIHKIRNYGEDLFHEFSTSPMATIDINAVDRATNRLCVVVTRDRYKTRTVRLIEKVLSRHYLTDIAHISEEPVESSDSDVSKVARHPNRHPPEALLFGRLTYTIYPFFVGMRKFYSILATPVSLGSWVLAGRFGI